jgi:hypothetical protein
MWAANTAETSRPSAGPGVESMRSDGFVRLKSSAGLGGQCRHAIIRPTRRGTVYLRCGRAAWDSRFPKYPQLPMLSCEGHQPQPDQELS